MSNELVSVVIVTCRVKCYLAECIKSVKRQSYPAAEIIVIDNSLFPSAAESPFFSNEKEIKLCSGEGNLFYGGGLNKGIQMSCGEFLLCLNDDVILDENFIREALAGFHVDHRIGMVSGKILRHDGKTIDSTGLLLSPMRTARERGYNRKDRGGFQKQGYIFGVSGATAFYRRRMLDEIRSEGKYFDPELRMFYEDLDISWRAQRAGWKGYFVPGALAYHLRGATLRKEEGIGRQWGRRYISDEFHADLIKNRYRVLIKNESVLGFFLHLPFIFFYDFIVWFYILILKRNVVRILFSSSLGWASAFKKRKPRD